MTSIAAGIGMTGMSRRFLHNKYWMLLPVLMLVLLAPSLTQAKAGTMKAAPAHGLIGSDGSQPVSLSIAQWIRALASIHYVSEGIFASGSPEPVFSDQQIRILAPQIQQAFANIGAGQAVAFHQDKIRGGIFFNGGRLYWHFSLIGNSPAFKLTPLGEENARISYAVEAIPEEDIDISYWRLIPQQGQALYRDRPDLLAMPVSTLAVDTTGTALLSAAKQPKPPARIQSHPVATADVNHRDAVGRINTLHRLLNKGLITKNEYREKLEAIISGYETQHPSPEAGLEFLRLLNRKGLIAPDMLQQQRKQILDRL